jgi:hypothetical protein
MDCGPRCFSSVVLLSVRAPAWGSSGWVTGVCVGLGGCFSLWLGLSTASRGGPRDGRSPSMLIGAAVVRLKLAPGIWYWWIWREE